MVMSTCSGVPIIDSITLRTSCVFLKVGRIIIISLPPLTIPCAGDKRFRKAIIHNKAYKKSTNAGLTTTCDRDQGYSLRVWVGHGSGDALEVVSWQKQSGATLKCSRATRQWEAQLQLRKQLTAYRTNVRSNANSFCTFSPNSSSYETDTYYKQTF